MVRMKCPHGVSPKSNCDICYKEYRRKYQKKYQQSPKYKEHKRKYMKEYMRLHSSKVFNPTPAKPVVSDGRTSENRSDSNEKRTAQGRGAIPETGGGLNSEV